MAIVTSITGKRPHRWLSVNHNHQSPNSSRFKRQKVPTAMSHTPSPSSKTTNATVSRVSRYPETKQPFHREVHAPCRPRKFDYSTNSRSSESSFIARSKGNLLNEKYQKAKHSALATVALRGKGKEKDNHKVVVVSEDSNVEDVQEVRTPVKDHKLKENETVHLDTKVDVVHGEIQKQSISSAVSELSNGKLNVVDAVEMFDTLSLSPKHDISSIRAYKKLLQAVNKRKDTIGRLRYEIQLNEKRRSAFELRPKKELVEVKTY